MLVIWAMLDKEEGMGRYTLGLLIMWLNWRVNSQSLAVVSRYVYIRAYCYGKRVIQWWEIRKHFPFWTTFIYCPEILHILERLFFSMAK